MDRFSNIAVVVYCAMMLEEHIYEFFRRRFIELCTGNTVFEYHKQYRRQHIRRECLFGGFDV